MTIVAQVLAFVGAMISTRLLGPTNSGLWNALLIAFTYSGYLDPGIRTGVSRELPILLGKGDTEAEGRIRDVGFFATLVSAACSMVVLLISAHIVSQQADPLFVYGLRIMATAGALLHLYSYYQTLCRSYGRFELLGVLQVVFSGMGLAVGIPMIIAFALPGRIWTFLATYVVCLTVIAWQSGIAPRPRMDFARLVSTARIGLPILAAVVLYGFLLTLDRVFIGGMLGVRELGFFSLGVMIAQYLNIVPNSVTEVLYPRMAKEYGKSGEASQSLSRLFFMPLSTLAFLMLAAISVVCLLIPAFIRLLLPDFGPSIPVVQISVFGTFFAALCGPTGNTLLVLNKRYQYLLLLAAAVAVNAVLDYVALNLGGGIVGVALTGPIVSWGCHSVVLISVAARSIGMSWTRIAAFLVKTYAPIVYVAVFCVIADRLLPFTDSSLLHLGIMSLARLLYLALVGLPLVWWSNREIGWVRMVKAHVDPCGFLASGSQPKVL